MDTSDIPTVHERGLKAIPVPVDEQQVDQLLKQFSGHLLSVVELELSDELRSNFDISDLIQETLVQGHQQFGNFKGRTERELSEWLTRILQSHLAHLKSRYERGGREIGCEQPPTSDTRSKTFLTSNFSNQPATNGLLQTAIAQLPYEYREVINYRHNHHLSFFEIGIRMELSPHKVRQLWGCAIIQLGRLLAQI